MLGNYQQLSDCHIITSRHLNILIQDTDSEQDAEVVVRRKPGPKPKNPTSVGSNTRGRPPKDVIPLKKRLHALAKYLLDYAVSKVFFFNLLHPK